MLRSCPARALDSTDRTKLGPQRLRPWRGESPANRRRRLTRVDPTRRDQPDSHETHRGEGASFAISVGRVRHRTAANRGARWRSHASRPSRTATRLLSEPRAPALLRLLGRALLTAGDAAQALLLLKELRPKPVQSCRTMTAESLSDRLIVRARQRCFHGDPQLDGVRDLASGRGIALTFENLRELTSNGRSQSYASNPHRPHATGLDVVPRHVADDVKCQRAS